MSATEETLVLLRSIDASLKLLVQQRRAEQPKVIASDRDLDGKYGDPELKFMPRDWAGPSFKNRHYSECPPELLDLVAESCDYFAAKAEETDDRTTKGKPVAEFRRADAARARGWAKRMRDGTHRAPTTTETDGVGDEWAEPTHDWS
jgi:hypothetical protein